MEGFARVGQAGAVVLVIFSGLWINRHVVEAMRLEFPRLLASWADAIVCVARLPYPGQLGRTWKEVQPASSKVPGSGSSYAFILKRLITCHPGDPAETGHRPALAVAAGSWLRC